MIENADMSLLAPEKTTPQVQESILKDPIRRIKTPSDITQGHSLEDAYLANLTTIQKLSLGELRQVESKDLLRPTEDGTASLVMREKEDSSWMCTLRVQGNFLQNVQLDAAANCFQGLPFTGSSKVLVRVYNSR